MAFRIGGIPEVVGDAASLHEFGDIHGTAAALDALIDSPAGAKALGDRGRERAEKLFTAARVVPQYEELYRGVIGR